MANNWLSLQMTMTKNNNTQIVHYETDTANIVDFEQASNNLITAALTVFANNTTLRGTTSVNSLKTSNPINISNDGGIYIRDNEDYDKINGHIYTEDDYLLKIVAGSAASGSTGNQGTGAGLLLSKIPNDGDGSFNLFAAKNNSTRISLIGNAQDGSLKWNGQDVLTKKMLKDEFKTLILDLIYPVGSVIYTATSAIPDNLKNLGGTWTQIAQGRVIVGVGSGTDSNNTSKSFTVGNNAGEYTHKLVTNELASHGHGSGGTITTSAAGDHVHSRGNMDIVGTFGTGGNTPSIYKNDTSGAFTNVGTNGRKYSSANTSQDDRTSKIKLTASDAWSGYTSSPLNPETHKNAKTHTHTVEVSLSNTGGNGFHNNVQPSYGLYIWQRTA